MKKQILSVTISALILGTFFINGCSTYQKPQTPKLNSPSSFKNANSFTALSVNDAVLRSGKWWQKFHDKQLNQLIERALQNNLNYQIALKNIKIAHTYVVENTTSLFPQINLNYSSSRNAPSLNNFNNINKQNVNNQIYNLYQLNGSVSYEVDVWHKVGNIINQAKANEKISVTDSEIIKIALISSIVDAYFQIAALNANIENLEQQSAATQAILSMNSTQYQGGLINVENIDSAKIQAAAIKINLANLIKQRQILFNTLAYLIGEYPERFALDSDEAKLDSNMDIAKIVPAGLPAQMLSNRPDIQSSFANVLAYGYAQKQSITNFFPSFTLTGTYGFASTSMANFTSGGSLLWNFGANILQPLFDWGKRVQQYRRAQLQYETAILGYKNTVINAFKEVDNALITYQQDYLALQMTRHQLAAAQEKFNAGDARYRAGMLNYATYLSYKLSYLQSKYSVNAQIQILISDAVQVYKTLGIGI